MTLLTCRVAARLAGKLAHSAIPDSGLSHVGRTKNARALCATSRSLFSAAFGAGTQFGVRQGTAYGAGQSQLAASVSPQPVFPRQLAAAAQESVDEAADVLVDLKNYSGLLTGEKSATHVCSAGIVVFDDLALGLMVGTIPVRLIL